MDTSTVFRKPLVLRDVKRFSRCFDCPNIEGTGS